MIEKVGYIFNFVIQFSRISLLTLYCRTRFYPVYRLYKFVKNPQYFQENISCQNFFGKHIFLFRKIHNTFFKCPLIKLFHHSSHFFRKFFYPSLPSLLVSPALFRISEKKLICKDLYPTCN